jgi:hypothetical protein
MQGMSELPDKAPGVPGREPAGSKIGEATVPGGKYDNPDHILNAPVVQASSCTTCDAGAYSKGEGNTECTFCLPGKYQSATEPKTGDMSCTPCKCPDGHVSAGCGKGDKGTCECAPAGKIAENFPMRQKITKAPPGKYGPLSCSSNMQAFILCAQGSYTADEGKSECDLCAPGTITTVAGQIKCDDCPGAKTTYKKGGTECLLCPEGKQTIADSNANITCVECAPGKQQNKNSGKCENCDPGRYSSAANKTCVACAAQTYAASAGMAQCKACPKGKEALLIGAKKCDLADSDCPACKGDGSLGPPSKLPEPKDGIINNNPDEGDAQSATDAAVKTATAAAKAGTVPAAQAAVNAALAVADKAAATVGGAASVETPKAPPPITTAATDAAAKKPTTASNATLAVADKAAATVGGAASVETPNAPPRFVKGAKGVDACPSADYKKITDQATCAAGATAVGLPYNGKSSDLTHADSLCNYCEGCSSTDGGGKTVRVDHTHGDRTYWICESVTAATITAPKMTTTTTTTTTRPQVSEDVAAVIAQVKKSSGSRFAATTKGGGGVGGGG